MSCQCVATKKNSVPKPAKRSALASSAAAHLAQPLVIPTRRLPIQAKLTIGQPNDKYEQEADSVADRVMRMSDADVAQRVKTGTVQPMQIQRRCPECEEEMAQRQPMEEEEELQAKEMPGKTPTVAPNLESRINSLKGGGQPLDSATRSFFEPRFGHDFSNVRVHTDSSSADTAKSINARAFTLGNHVAMGSGEYQPNSQSGQRLLGHELTHVVQQGELQTSSKVQKQEPAPIVITDRLTEPLSGGEWQRLEIWQSNGEIGSEPLSADPDHNALIVADAIFCDRLIRDERFYTEDPLLCAIPEITRADPRVRQLARHVTARGPIINWSQTNVNQRMTHVMRLLVNEYNFPSNGAAGLVGNLRSESGVLPTKIEAAGRVIRNASPLTERDFAGQETEFTAAQVMNRNRVTSTGPKLPGVGIAQWTTSARRSGLFQHVFQGRQQGAAILFNMDAQVDYLVDELRSNYRGVYNVIIRSGVSLNTASDEVIYNFEIPSAILTPRGSSPRRKLPRSNTAVQAVFAKRRANSQRALRVFQASV